MTQITSCIDIFTGNFHNSEPEATDTDEWALEHQFVSVVPMQIDMTSYDTLVKLQDWNS